MKRPFVIAVNSISGGGKTALTHALGEKLDSCKIFHFDDFDATNVYPNDIFSWWKRGDDISEFDCPGMHGAVCGCLNRGEVKTVVLDYPFGRLHARFKDVINCSIYIDTPLDVALSRRILRDYIAQESAPAKMLVRLKAELNSYLTGSRDVYVDSSRRYRDKADLILDGTNSVAQLCEQVISHLGVTREIAP